MTDKWSFKNAAEFQEIFSKRECGNGNVQRRNNILLQTFLDKDFHKWLIENGEIILGLDWFKINNMNILRAKALEMLKMFSYKAVTIYGDPFIGEFMNLGNFLFFSPDYKTDEFRGLCEDGDINAIRFVRKDNGKVYKKKAGRMFKHLIDVNEAGKHFPTQLKTWLCEQLTEEWRAYASKKMPKHILSTDVTFADIYGCGDYECIDFGSCMNNKYQYSFYEVAVKAMPAALISTDEKRILARCVIFTEVRDEDTGEILRLAERQYSEGGNETLKHVLIERLIEAKLIDGYKAIGAGCHDANSFVSNTKEDWSERDFSIRCNLDYDDTLSYQDSFKWYDFAENRAYNYEIDDADMLDTTDSEFRGDGNYDSYHDEWVREDVVSVYVNGREETCSENDLEDFYFINGEYHHYDDCFECPNCGEMCTKDDAIYEEILDEYYCCCSCRDEAIEDRCYFCAECNELVLKEDATYSCLTGEYYCDDICRDDAEEKWKEENWEYSDYDNDYFESVIPYLVWDAHYQIYDEQFISGESLERLLERGRMLEYEGVYYLDYDAYLRLPLDMVMEIA